MNNYFYYSITLKDDTVYNTAGFDLSDAIDNLLDEEYSSVNIRNGLIKDTFVKSIKRIKAKNYVPH